MTNTEQLAKLEADAETCLEYYEQTGSMSVLRAYEECINKIRRSSQCQNQNTQITI